jgi:hypothetical protein
MNQPRSPQYRMADRLAGGKLADELARHAAEGHSLRQTCLHLYADYGIEVTPVTVAKWSTVEPEPVAS